MTRCARERAVYFFEEPVFDHSDMPRLQIDRGSSVTVVVPHLPAGLTPAAAIDAQRALLDDFLAALRLDDFIAWYYTPMALAFSDHLDPVATVYDCMDELSAFQGAPPALVTYEQALMRRADLVLTGGHSLFDAKRDRHDNIHPFPSSVDVAHFAQARHAQSDPPAQAAVPRPRLGFFGVIDERMDVALLDGIAAVRPDWQLMLIGPVVKIDPATLPARPNIHYLGQRGYDELPQYIAGWDVALLPFARNEATRFISPTKTPEYLAAGKPVVSTSIRDVVRPYQQLGLVRIADDPIAFVSACEDAMAEAAADRIRAADVFLRKTSWDGTWRQIDALMRAAMRRDPAPSPVQQALRCSTTWS